MLDLALVLRDEDVLQQRGDRPVVGELGAAITLDPTPWAQGLLTPLLVAAGYDVTFGAPDDAALVVRLAGGISRIGEVGGAEALELAADATGGVAVDRYYRATLAALVAAACARAA